MTVGKAFHVVDIIRTTVDGKLSVFGRMYVVQTAVYTATDRETRL